MTIVTAVTTRLASSIVFLIRTAVQRLGIGPVVLAATAVAALLYSWRGNANRDNPQRRRRRTLSRSSGLPPDQSETADENDATGEGKPQWLSRVRKVTLGSKWTLAERCDLFCREGEDEDVETTVEEEKDQIVKASKATGEKGKVILRSSIRAGLKRLAKLFDVYFIVRIDNDEAEGEVMNALTEAGMFESNLLDKRKVLFCETDVGRVSVARQLEPHLHIDETLDVIVGLQRFVHFVALVTNDVKCITEPLGSNVAKFPSLASFFS